MTQVKGHQELINNKREYENRPSLIPVAIPGDPLYLRTAAMAIMEFNSKGEQR